MQGPDHLVKVLPINDRALINDVNHQPQTDPTGWERAGPKYRGGGIQRP